MLTIAVGAGWGPNVIEGGAGSMPVHGNARNAPVHAPRAPGHEKVPFDPAYRKKAAPVHEKIAIAPVPRQKPLSFRRPVQKNGI